MKTGSDKSGSAFQPLKNPKFRLLWLAWFAANIALWMNEVTSAWIMTSLTEDKLLVALVQTATTLPVFVLGLASGALADIVDRRRYFAATQIWVSVVAIALAFLSFTDALTPELLILLVAANGVGMALRMPVFAAIIPSIVERPQLPSALALNSGAANLSRIAGPMIAGVILVALGSHFVYLLNALLSIAACILILRWKSEPKNPTLPGERFFAAMRVGAQHVRQSPPLQIIMVRVFVFFLHSISLVALLPLIAKELYLGGANTYTLLLAAMSVGAISFVFLLPRARRYLSREAMVVTGTLVHASATAVVAVSPSLIPAVIAMVVSGVAWIGTVNAFSTAAQLALPDWVRARGMAIYQMALMGGMAAGAFFWGYVADQTSLKQSLLIAAASGPFFMLFFKVLVGRITEGEDLTPVAFDTIAPFEMLDPGRDDVPIMVTIEYLVASKDAEEFKQIMEKTRRSRLRQGALSWGLFRDASDPQRFIEYFVDENWIEHRRRMERFTAEDVGLRQKRLALHQGEHSPILKKYVAQ